MPGTSELQEGQCGACGEIGGHDTNCPADKVTITDKREQKRLEAELRKAGRALEREDTDVETSIARADRIAELRAKHGSDDGLTDEEGAELMRLQGDQMEAERKVAEAEQADLAAAAAGRIDARTAFLVIANHDGSCAVTTNMDLLVEIDHEANFDEMYAAMAIVMRDIQAASAARDTLLGIQGAGKAMAAQSQANRMLSTLQRSGIDPRQVRRQ